ncbi:MAG: hypothetical protein KKA76_07365 [Proteobacteria bacterium]|nr:hypothetical protein [Pseudomonadota bacterium]
MNPNQSFSTMIVFFFFFTALLFSGHAEAQSNSTEKGGSSKTGYSLSYTPIYQFETDMGKGGQFDVQRHLLRFNISRSIEKRWTVGLGLSFDYERWNFSGIERLASVDTWDEIFRPGIRVPIFYSTTTDWRFGFIPSVDFSGASGAKVSESLSYGAVVSAAHVSGPDLMLGFGAGIYDRLDQAEFFPYVIINWKINEKFLLTNPFPAGPVGPAGLEVVYNSKNSWELGMGSAYRSYRFRLDDSSSVADGIGEVDFWAYFVRVGWRLGESYRFDINGGMLFAGDITIEDKNGNKLGETDYDTAPFVGVTLKGRF